jgi:hypothetical protein
MGRHNSEQVATTAAYTPPYNAAPNSALADSGSSRHISFLNSLPLTTESERAASCASRDENEMGSHNGQNHISSNRDDRRTSFGFPITSQFLIPTPQLRPPKTDSDEQSLAVSHDDESLTIPPPPPCGKPERALEDYHGNAVYDDSLQRSIRPCASSSSNGSSSSGRDASSPNPLQESQRLNMGALQFEPNVLIVTTTTQKNLATTTTTTTSSREPTMSGNLEKKAAPTMHDASLLLGLRTDMPITTTDANPNNHSPTSTVPDMQDEMDDTPPNLHNHTHHSSDATAAAAAVPHTVTAAGPAPSAGTTTDPKTLAELPKTCFPAPVPKKYPRTLSLPNDSIKLNALHCFIRAELLEIFVVEPSPEHLKFRHAPSSAVGRVGLRCVHCARARTNSMNASRDDEAPMAVFYPKSVHEIYRLVTSWQRCHVRKCKSLPPSVRNVWKDLRETEKSRGKTAYWADAARQIGLVDCPSRAGGIRFDLAVVAQLELEDDEDMVMTTAKQEDESGVDENVRSGPATTASSQPDASTVAGADTLLPPGELSKGNGLLRQPNYTTTTSFQC